jgi:hypothetical protein
MVPPPDMLNNNAAPGETTMLSRRTAAKSLALAVPFLSASAALAVPGSAPGADWQKGTSEDAGFRSDGCSCRRVTGRGSAW